MAEGYSRLNGPIPPHPMYLPGYNADQRRGRDGGKTCEGASMLQGPIGGHPGYENENDRKLNQATEAQRPIPRTRPEGEANFKLHQGTIASLGLLEVKGQGLFQPSVAKKPKEKNHFSENLRRMRQIQRKAREKEVQQEASKPVPVKGLWKSTKYNHVTSKLKESRDASTDAPRPSTAPFLRAHSRAGASPGRPFSAMSSSRPSTASSSMAAENGTPIDFVRLNGMLASHARIRRSPSLTSLDDIKKKAEQDFQEYRASRGATPDYLVKRKEQWQREEEERIRSIPDPDMPPGHRKMPDAERKQTLEHLKSVEHDLIRQLSGLPIALTTMRAREQKADIERRISEVDEALKIFSRPKVFVKLDS